MSAEKSHRYDDYARECLRLAQQAKYVRRFRDEWKNKATGEVLKSWTMLITEPNDFVAEVHDRMPVVLESKDFASWLNDGGAALPRLWRDQGKCSEARDHLALVYGWITEGFNTLDLKEAKALLDELTV